MNFSPELRRHYEDRTVCVTGGAGFIGSHLVDALVALNARVTVVDDLSNGREANLEAVRSRVRFIHASILDTVAMTIALERASTIFHLAAIASVPRSVAEPELYFTVNAVGTLRVLEAARLKKIPAFIYAASSSAYGDATQSPKTESMAPLPLSPYASAKFAGEHLLRTYCHCYGLTGCSLRYFNIFGPRQRPDSQYAAVIPRFISALSGTNESSLQGDGRKPAADNLPVIFGDGTQTRDFTYVENAVLANLLAGMHAHSLKGEHLNVACGHSYSLNKLLSEIAGLLHVEPRCTHAPPRVGEVVHSLADISLAKRTIGYLPAVDFREGLARTVAAFQRDALI
ncbi:MAG TPA: NAD-dependent epimerase/dehydratase family protein [Phycisphaerales bacterium]|nr:NAD-dependent epimerase/dehydratase family protein [Phycisphaerales bacterium]